MIRLLLLIAVVGLAAAAVHPLVSCVWPAAGIALFALLRYGVGLWLVRSPDLAGA